MHNAPQKARSRRYWHGKRQIIGNVADQDLASDQSLGQLAEERIIFSHKGLLTSSVTLLMSIPTETVVNRSLTGRAMLASACRPEAPPKIATLVDAAWVRRGAGPLVARQVFWNATRCAAGRALSYNRVALYINTALSRLAIAYYKYASQ